MSLYEDAIRVAKMRIFGELMCQYLQRGDQWSAALIKAKDEACEAVVSMANYFPRT